jgi:hypothetical protein
MMGASLVQAHSKGVPEEPVFKGVLEKPLIFSPLY